MESIVIFIFSNLWTSGAFVVKINKIVLKFKVEPTLGEAFHKLVIFSFTSNLDLEATVKCCKCVIFSRTWSISGSVVEKKCGGTTQIIPPTQLMHQTHNHACFVYSLFCVFARFDVVPFCLWRKYGFVKSMVVSREEGPQITLCMEHQQTPIYAHKQKRKQKVYISDPKKRVSEPIRAEIWSFSL